MRLLAKHSANLGVPQWHSGSIPEVEVSLELMTPLGGASARIGEEGSVAHWLQHQKKGPASGKGRPHELHWTEPESVGGKTMLPQGGKIDQPAAQTKIVGIVDDRFRAQ